MSKTIKCAFRLMGLAENSLNTLIKNCLENITFRQGSSHKNRESKSIIIPIEKNIDESLFKKLLELAPPEAYHDFFVSVSSSEQTVVINVPSKVLELYKILGGEMCFSYTCTFDPED